MPQGKKNNQMIKVIQLVFVLAFSPTLAFSGVIPENRMVDWTQAGHKGMYIEHTRVYNFISEGGVNDGVTPNDDAFTKLMTKMLFAPGVVYFPSGAYLFTKQIIPNSNCILHGESSQSTFLYFNFVREAHAILVEGAFDTKISQLATNAHKNERVIEVKPGHSFVAGDHLYIVDNDSALVTSSYAYQSTAQIAQIDSIRSNTIYLKSALRRKFIASENSRVQSLNMKENVGIENLTLHRFDQTVMQSNTIHFQYAYNCWVKCVESYFCNYSHVVMRYCSSVEVTGSYFKDAFDYGGSGRGYGIVMQYGSSECLVSGNIFNHLRHSMILGLGANGNVLSYNYSINPYWTGSIFLPSNSAGDLTLHGDYPYCNLMEGNTVQNIVIDDSHGPNGPYNTYFRNRAELYGIFMNFSFPTDSQNFVGNEITASGLFIGQYSLAGKGHFEYGNNKTGTIIPTATTNLSDSSLYLKAMPSYYWNASKWPPIGIPNTINSQKIETQTAYQAAKYTTCSSALIYTNTATKKQHPASISVHPNPFKNNLHILVPSNLNIHPTLVQIYSAEGKLIGYETYTATIDVSTLKDGLYILRVSLSNQTTFSTRIIKNSAL